MVDENRLKFVDADRFDGRGLATTVARAELERALDSGQDAELVLDVARVTGPDAEVEAHTLTVALERADLEKLLRADDEEIGLEFDPDDVEAALGGAEVEAHGWRARAAVLAVAVAGAGAMTAQAAAQPTADVGGKSVPAARGMTAQQIWATASPAAKRAYAQGAAQREARLRTPAPFHATSGARGIDIPTPTTAEGALAGEAALLIAAAGLAVRSRRGAGRAKPA